MAVNSRLKTSKIIGQGKHSIDRVIQIQVPQGKKLLTQACLQHLGIMVTEK